MAAGGEVTFAFYLYDPSLAAAIVFIILFGISSFAHLFQLVRARTWYFIPFVLGGFFEMIGYIGRALSAQETPNFTRNPYIIQALLILIGPAFFAASIYMILGRIVRLADAERHSLIRSSWLTKIFVAADVLSFAMQGGGGAMLSIADSLEEFQRGEHVILGGLFVQLIAFSLFIIVTAIFHRRLLRDPTPAAAALHVPWQRFLFVLYAASTLILVRSVFRVIEYIQGYDGFLQSNEYWLYIFDAALMFICMLLLNIFHPSQIIAAGQGRRRKGAAGFEEMTTRSGSEMDLRSMRRETPERMEGENEGYRDVERGTGGMGVSRMRG